MFKKLIYLCSVVFVLCLAESVSNAIPFYQDDVPDGILCMEAENFDRNTPQGDHTWEFVTDPTGYSGTGAMRALPDTGDLIINEPEDYLVICPRLDYEVKFVKSGTHYVWVRWYAISNETNSCHVGLNGNHNPASDRVGNIFTYYEWLWAGDSDLDNYERLTMDIPSPGTYTINVWMREDGYWFDKIVFTTNRDYTPTGLGPEESIRGPRIKAYGPVPKNGELLTLQNSSTTAGLSWSSGVYADNHNVYFGTDVNDVIEATVDDPREVLLSQNQVDTTYNSPDYLEFGQTYYWRIDEVNDLEPNSPWKGDVWSFTTAGYIVVDDFEDYNDFPPNEIYNTWLDGWGDPTNGSTSGHPAPDFVGGKHILEDVFVHEGLFSFPVYYDNSVGLSEVTKSINADWTVADVITLTLFYYGDAANALEPMYVALNDNAVIVNDDPRAALDNEWNQWDILLQDFADMGVDLTNVNSLSIGFGNKDNPTAGGSGCVFFDDIRLYRSPPIEVEPEPEAVNPGTTNLVAYYDFENDVRDGSGQNRHATAYNDPIYVSGPTDFGTAISLDGMNDYIGLPIGSVINTLTDCTITAWVNWPGERNTWQRVFDFGNPPASADADPVFYMFLTTDAGSSNLHFAITIGGNAAGAEDQTTSRVACPSGWHHVAVTIDADSNTHTLYLDGKNVAQNTAARYTPSDLGATTQNWIGRSQWTADPYFRGTIDEFRIYNRVLSDAELYYLMGR
jgi:hypothetical protein